jgi:hypothetical protein
MFRLSYASKLGIMLVWYNETMTLFAECSYLRDIDPNHRQYSVVTVSRLLVEMIR